MMGPAVSGDMGVQTAEASLVCDVRLPYEQVDGLEEPSAPVGGAPPSRHGERSRGGVL